MISQATLLSLCLIHLLAVASPGPDFILVARNSLKAKLRAGLATAAGITLGNGVHILYSVLAASYLSTQHATLFELFKVAGGLYLGWIGWKCASGMVRSWGSDPKGVAPPETLSTQESSLSLVSAFGMGLTTTLLNAKAAIYFVSIVTQFIRSRQPLAYNISAVMLLLLITGSWFSFVAWVTGLDKLRAGLIRHQSKIEGAMGIVLLGYAGLIVIPPVIAGIKPVLGFV